MNTLMYIVDCFSRAAKAFDLTISLKKTEVLYQTAPQETCTHPKISIDDKTPNAVNHITKLGSMISNDATVDKDLDSRLSKASSPFSRLSKRVWKNHSLRIFSKVIVVPTLLYDKEVWVL